MYYSNVFVVFLNALYANSLDVRCSPYMYLEVYPLVILYGLSVHCHHLMTDLSPFTEDYVQGGSRSGTALRRRVLLVRWRQ